MVPVGGRGAEGLGWKTEGGPKYLSPGVIGDLALVHSIHEGQNPGHVEGQLLGKEVVGHRV